jgi:hypothetical protein
MLCLYFQGWADLDELTAHLEKLRQEQKTKKAAPGARASQSWRVASRCALAGATAPVAQTTPPPLLKELSSASQ